MKLSEIIETLQRHEPKFDEVDVLSLEFDGDTFTVETGPTEAAQETRKLERQYGTGFNGNAH